MIIKMIYQMAIYQENTFIVNMVINATVTVFIIVIIIIPSFGKKSIKMSNCFQRFQIKQFTCIVDNYLNRIVIFIPPRVLLESTLLCFCFRFCFCL